MKLPRFDEGQVFLNFTYVIGCFILEYFHKGVLFGCFIGLLLLPVFGFVEIKEVKI